MNNKIELTEIDNEITPLQQDRGGKFTDPSTTLDGSARASVDPRRLTTLWINTGSLCNLSCGNCYIESTPTNDRLVYVSVDEVRALLDEIAREQMGTEEIGFTGGEPFLNPDMMAILQLCLQRGFRTLTLTNGMNTLLRERDGLEALYQEHGDRLRLRVSLDHYIEATHAQERGERSWKPAMESLRWLSGSGIPFAVAGRLMWEESEEDMRRGYAAMFEEEGIELDAANTSELVLFPEMDGSTEVPEITTACWNILKQDPANMMCASSRMVVKHKGDDKLSIQACTLLAYDQRFNMGSTLKQAWQPVKLNHPHCAKFCVLGGGSCSA